MMPDLEAPPVTLFKSNDGLWSLGELKDLILGIVEKLVEENQAEKDAAHPCHDFIYSLSTTRFIFSASETLRLSSHIKYTAMEMFHRFMIGHMDSLLTHVTSTTDEGRPRTRLLRAVSKKLREQAPLRAATCLMLASKLVSHKKSVTPHVLVSRLKVCCSSLSLREICKSEVQILEQIDSRCNRRTSLLDHIGVMVSVAGLWQGDGTGFSVSVSMAAIHPLSAEELEETSHWLLELACLNRDKMYQALYSHLTGLPIVHPKHQAAFSRVKADRVLLAGSMVAAAAAVLGGRDLCAAVTSAICSHLPTTPRDLLTLATCVLDCANLNLNLLDLLTD